ncbi:MAG: hypothetical protein A2V98_00630 [Planctomycetes bacterium RBG_16_64_12]|nr:MAG: hypothetical protein A2V98_00630 [Planctomycetes bacterium RBG_16_64_12]
MACEKRRHRHNVNEPGDAHELTFSCYRNYSFLLCDRVRAWLGSSLDAARSKLQFDLWAYVFMPEHVHLIVYPRRRKHDIAEIRQAIKEPVGREAMKYLRTHRPDWLAKLTRRRGKREERLFWQSVGVVQRGVSGRYRGLAGYVGADPGRMARFRCVSPP